MKLFAELYTALDETNKTNEKVAALKRYFQAARPADASPNGSKRRVAALSTST